MINEKFSFENLSKYPNRLKIFTGLNPNQLLSLKQEFYDIWETQKSLSKKDIKQRQRAEGGGRKSVVPYFEDKIIVFLFYAKYYPSYSLMEVFFEIDNATICRIIKEISKALGNRILIDKNKRKIISPEELFYCFPDLKKVIVDATEQKINKKDDNFYSGKSGRRTIKTQIITDNKSRILFSDDYCEGKKHDSNYLRDSKTGKWLNKKPPIMAVADLGYQGMDKVFPIPIFTPKKRMKNQKKLREEDKIWNKKIHSERVVVEHAFGRLKKYKILAEGYRNSIKIYSDIFRSIVSVINLRMATS